MEEIPGLNEIMPPGGKKKAAPAQPQPAPRSAPEAQPAAPQPIPAQPAAAPPPASAARPASPAPAPQAASQSAPGQSTPTATVSTDINQPTIVAALFLSAPFFGVTGLIGLVLAYVWRGENPHGWEATHYTYMIRGFWLWFVGFIVGFILTFVIIGIFVILAAYALIIVRGVLSLMRALKQEPMPDPETWLA